MANNDFKNTMVNNNIYIRTYIDDEKCADVISGLSQMEQKTQFKPNNKPTKIIAPYENFGPNQPNLNVYITSDGGDLFVARAIINLFNMLNAKGVIIRTYNLSYAASSASVIAISGTPGYRYMAYDAYNFIHFGKRSLSVTREAELPHLINNEKQQNQLLNDFYLANTNLTKKDLKNFFNCENSGRLYASQCLAKGICDWVITPRGWTNNIQDLTDQNIR